MSPWDASHASLAQMGEAYLPTMLRTIQQEYPNAMQHVMRDAQDCPLPHTAHPAFYGCFDWHSSVGMHWAVIRLMRLLPDTRDWEPALIFGTFLRYKNTSTIRLNSVDAAEDTLLLTYPKRPASMMWQPR